MRVPIPDDGCEPETAYQLITEGIMQEHGWPDPMPRFPKMEAGLDELGWSLWPHGPPESGIRSFRQRSAGLQDRGHGSVVSQKTNGSSQNPVHFQTCTPRTGGKR